MLFGCSDFNARNFALVCLLLHKSVFGVELGPSRPSKRDVSKAGHVGAAGDASPSGREPHFDTLDRTEDVLGSLLKLDLEGAVRESQANGPFSVLAKNIDIPGQDSRTTPDDRDVIQGIIGMTSKESRDSIRKLQHVVNHAYQDYYSHEDISNTETKGQNNFQGIGRHSNDSFDAIHDKTGDNVGMVQEVVTQAYHNNNSHEDISNTGVKGKKDGDNNFQGIERHSNDSFDDIHDETGYNEGKVQQVVIDGHRTDGSGDSHKTDIMEGRNGDTDLPEFIPSLRSATAIRSSENEGGSEGKLDKPKDESGIILFPDQINPTVDEESDDSLVETYILTQAPKREKPKCGPNERFFAGRCRKIRL
ncbi:uncharacterized protein LOC124162024 isoform X2 [Ischnura elegans]|uniref:uncharacterized protein LOC124162024 isoform X2 n=1 Tax=Ischnura elegans TaxID=197161 RepID=UPI001ED8AB7F|nr:uncharacterized protein LOC124162024 isoform X2 [Ischnura elegans]